MGRSIRGANRGAARLVGAFLLVLGMVPLWSACGGSGSGNAQPGNPAPDTTVSISMEVRVSNPSTASGAWAPLVADPSLIQSVWVKVENVSDAQAPVLVSLRKLSASGGAYVGTLSGLPVATALRFTASAYDAATVGGGFSRRTRAR